MADSQEEKPDQDPAILTLERIFTNNEFQQKGFGPIRWLSDDSGYFALETADSQSEDEPKPKPQQIVHYDLNNDNSQLVVSSQQLIPEGQENPLKIANFHWSEQAQCLLIFTNTKRVWRLHTRGDYWVYDVQDGRLTKLGGDVPDSSLMFAKFSPDGRSVAYVHHNNIYLQSLESSQITRLTTDGSDTIINGTSDWVYEEELFLRDGFLWSPDGRSIAYWQFDISQVGRFNIVNNTDSLYPRLKTFPYAKVGSPNAACRVGVVPVEGDQTTWFNLSDDSSNHYIHKMTWCPNSAELLIQQANRLQNCNQVILGNAADGTFRVVLTEQDEAWVDFHTGLKIVNDGQSFTWLSDRSGWRHIYLVSLDNGESQPITAGEFDVVDIFGVDQSNNWVYFSASPDNPTQLHLYRTPLDGTGTIERLTPAAQPGQHALQVSPKANWAVHQFSSFAQPSVISLLSLPDFRQGKVLQSNEELQQKVAALSIQPVEFFQLRISEAVALDAWCLKPADFDPNKKYPLLFYIYGEPSSLTAVDGWGGTKNLWHMMLVQQGFIIISVDSSGSAAPRGRSWRKSMYRQVGTKSAADQAAAARVLLEQRPYLDPDRVGIWGWSGGGTMTLNMLFRYPEIYKTGVAVASVSDQRLYDSVYQERYMGLLEENEAAYIDGSPITHVEKLSGNLLLIHGTGDDNVHYQCHERLVNELIKHNKRFTMMAYPNRTHGINEGDNTSYHLHDLMTRYLTEHLLQK